MCNYIKRYYSKNKLLCALGVEDLIMVEADDVVLICHKDKTQEIGKKKEGPEPLFENKIVSKYYDHVDFVQKVKIKDPSKPIKASVYYMSCDSEQCIPPTPKEFVFNS